MALNWPGESILICRPVLWRPSTAFGLCNCNDFVFSQPGFRPLRSYKCFSENLCWERQRCTSGCFRSVETSPPDKKKLLPVKTESEVLLLKNWLSSFDSFLIHSQVKTEPGVKVKGLFCSLDFWLLVIVKEWLYLGSNLTPCSSWVSCSASSYQVVKANENFYLFTKICIHSGYSSQMDLKANFCGYNLLGNCF